MYEDKMNKKHMLLVYFMQCFSCYVDKHLKDNVIKYSQRHQQQIIETISRNVQLCQTAASKLM